MMVNEFLKKVAGGEISNIDIRNLFKGLSDLDKSDLLQDMFIDSLADGLSGHNNEEQRLADAINMLCDVFGWRYDSVEKKYIHESKQVSKFETDEAKELFGKALVKGLIKNDGNKYEWADTASLYGYFVDKTSDYLNIRPSNNRIPWKFYGEIITNHSKILTTAKQAVNDYNNKGISPPEGDDKVNDICK